MRAALALLLPAVVGLGACSRPGGEADGPAPRPAAPVQVAEAARRDVPRTLAAVGTVEPTTTVSVRPLVTGAVASAFFRDGDEVAAGQRLFQIDPRPYQAALAQARGNLAHTRQQALNAQADVRRYAPLRRSGYVTQQQYDTAVAAARSLDADIQAQEAAVRRAELDLANCLVSAPVGGRTGAILVQAGNVVEANQAGAMVVISTLRPAYVAFTVPEANVATLRQGLGSMPVEATAGEARRQGTLTFVNNTVDPQSGTILARATFPNADEALWPGTFVTVRVVLEVRKDAVVIPPAAVVAGQAGSSVFVVKPDRTVEQRPVEVAQSDAEQAVIARGVAAGETVVTEGQLGLAPGARVEPRGAPAPAAGARADQGPGETGLRPQGASGSYAQAEPAPPAPAQAPAAGGAQAGRP